MRNISRARIHGLICLSVLIGILVAGLTPFRSPKNNVQWLTNENGLSFGRYGTIWSSRPFEATTSHDESSCSLEFWLQPGSIVSSNTILAFSTPENPLQFTVLQYHALLILQRVIQSAKDRTETIGIDGVFGHIRPVFVTLTSDAQQASIYVDGNLVRTFSPFSFGDRCTGILVLGTSPVGNSIWRGQLRGLAIYQRELTPEQVLRQYQSWTAHGRPEISELEKPVALYLFDEHRGSVVHNAVYPGIDLDIPNRYSLLHQKFLEPFWQEYKRVPGHWWDALVNILGFIPLGLVFCSYWATVRSLKHAALISVLLGFAVSLTIEVTQAYLPTRSSGTTDLITNTLGTFLGVRLYATGVVKRMIEKLDEGLRLGRLIK